ncbi:MAG TPA: UDP-N-acetylmuramate dehydrogenase [Candidatus Krumholzibacteria bacterium]|nr:UDP-N-acetylmuramate dehydrogenase [Candidatus Krumholzibacteria bacterium]
MTSAIDWPGAAVRLSAFLAGRVRVDEPMSKHTTIGVGGPARVMVFPRTPAEVGRVVRLALALGLPYLPVGKGSNLIVRDGGYDGVVIQLAEHMTRVRVDARTVWAEGGASFAALARKMTKAGRTGLEFGIGIPGSVGGAVRMNAGAFGGEVKDALARIRVVDEAGRLRAMAASQIVFSYRHTSIPARAVVVEAVFRCAPGTIRKDVYERSIGRKETQPIWERSFGSTFVNPPGRYAAEMIEGCGLKGTRLGGAMFSDLHANFIVNVEGRASAADVEALIATAQREVKKKYGVDLKTEVIVIGNR